MKRIHYLGALLVILSLLAALQAQVNVSQPPLSISISQATVGTTNGVNVVPTTSSAVALSSSAVSTSTTQSIKSSAGNLYGVSWANAQAATVWLQFYNSSSPTCGTSVVFSLAVPSSGTLNIPPGVLALHNFSTAIGFCCGTTATGSTACTSGDEAGTIFYD